MHQSFGMSILPGYQRHRLLPLILILHSKLPLKQIRQREHANMRCLCKWMPNLLWRNNKLMQLLYKFQCSWLLPWVQHQPLHSELSWWPVQKYNQLQMSPLLTSVRDLLGFSHKLSHLRNVSFPRTSLFPFQSMPDYLSFFLLGQLSQSLMRGLQPSLSWVFQLIDRQLYKLHQHFINNIL